MRVWALWALLAGAGAVRAQQYAPARYAEEPSYGYQTNTPNHMALAAYDKLKNSPQWVAGWPDPSLEIGQVSAVSVDGKGRVFVFHRGERTWGAGTFDYANRYIGSSVAIPEPTVLVLNGSTGRPLDLWGQNMFYMPHGLTVDGEGNTWLTDVAMHQVFKFAPGDRKNPALVLGVRFEPGDDEQHFCKPSAVAVLRSGEFFIADGYCNTRVIKHSPDGRRILEWGKENPPSSGLPPPYSLLVPHALALAEDLDLLCVADRENGRVQCFNATDGVFHSQYHNWLMGHRIFSVAYAPVNGGRLYVVNGPTEQNTLVRGFVIDMSTGKLVQWFSPGGAGLKNPHDIAVTEDGQNVYVVELDPYKVHKFVEVIAQNETRRRSSADGVASQLQPAGVPAGTPRTTPVKPTATIEEASAVYTGAGWSAWLGVAGGAAGGLGAVLVCALAAGVALLRARRTGWLKARNNRRRWDYAGGEFKLRRLLERPRGFQRVNTEESDEDPTPSTTMLQHSAQPANA